MTQRAEEPKRCWNTVTKQAAAAPRHVRHPVEVRQRQAGASRLAPTRPRQAAHGLLGVPTPAGAVDQVGRTASSRSSSER